MNYWLSIYGIRCYVVSQLYGYSQPYMDLCTALSSPIPSPSPPPPRPGPPAIAGCPSGFSQNPDTGNCYRYVSTTVAQASAIAACSNQGSSVVIASIHSDSDNTFIASLTGPDFFWIGLSRRSDVATCNAASVG
jgi:hypothetical protein